ncbi:PREDICTED: uroporphyrinogen-III synthase-like [Vollenhovia emeryi]|uniref:uroporphyrinogen-III synthase-like n=1 Tax=Vollenhovia emeryi TaxID=411798 RepID=UPI0005F4B17C|nr:PREDICTED: uroporphyrinogen-III synthase-like [Vollenhovia emeryi]XP_011868250.1 PREDICTED: uroporphyrinogen-III synthase-like [Vollenhovia emeryi]XP_011868251.1 PREDICTED: uroporphyrinogen-III synthase-like [Vollenhovia emeryi]XP_011868253.1 PREDICTED: uroporphyrinogen-III synthase-like [Vollenhovia emeryi]XP_011868254.1 PREDICTED: uroporphyrinogen-III synthase-like [Vollenhovia emeryi]XP_011868255.1 PREDICTED: uroporphyrinogen-III synthase-like [Vollenhovia emeryi]
MAGSGKTVVLCKGLSEKSDRQETYAETLESAGYRCECLQTLKFTFVNISELRACLSVANRYSGLILTSPRAVEAVALAARGDAGILHHWEQLPAYCVGPATDSLARSQLNLQHCTGSQSGNSKRLAEKIVLDTKKDSKPLLYPCSEIARETLSCIVEDNGIPIEKIVVYETLKSETLEQELPKMLDKSSSIFVFFSPSTVKYIKTQLERDFYNIKDIRAVAIGPVTRDALINSGFNVYATADKPEPAALIHAITAAESTDESENVL